MQGQITLFENTKKEIPMMPESYKASVRKKDNYRKTISRYWTDKEDEWLLNLRSNGYTKKEIGVSMGRSEPSISGRIKHLRKQNNTYNYDHADEKYDYNNKFLEIIKPKTVADPYCGRKNFYKDKVKHVDSNDEDESIQADYNIDALKFLCLMYSQDKKYDLIDLDPYGNACDCFDLAIKMAKKGIIITLGELGCIRWKNRKFAQNYYSIESFEDFTIETIIKRIQAIGRKNGKKLTPVFIKEWKNIGRVWFKIEKIK